MPIEQIKVQDEIFTITLSLTEKQLKLLRDSAGVLGTEDRDSVKVQLNLANAILDKKRTAGAVFKEVDTCKNGTCNCSMH